MLDIDKFSQLNGNKELVLPYCLLVANIEIKIEIDHFIIFIIFCFIIKYIIISGANDRDKSVIIYKIS